MILFDIKYRWNRVAHIALRTFWKTNQLTPPVYLYGLSFVNTHQLIPAFKFQSALAELLSGSYCINELTRHIL